jgi:hypothetical protein
LKDVIIEAPEGAVYSFRCGQWFDLIEGDGKIERALQPTSVEQIKKERSQSRESYREPHLESPRSRNHTRGSFILTIRFFNIHYII